MPGESYVVYGNAAPELDLNGSSSGIDVSLSTTFTNADIPLLANANLTLTDLNSTTLTGAQVTITNLLDGVDEILQADYDDPAVAGTNIIASYDQTTGILSLTGTDTLANYQLVLSSITYGNRSSTADLSDRIIEFVVDDGSAHSNTSTVSTLTLSLDSGPVNGVPVAVVDTLVDENDGNFSAGDLSLREALILVDAGGTITFDSNLATQDVGFGLGVIGDMLGDLIIDKAITIDGLGSDLTIASDFTAISSNSSTKIDVTLNALNFAASSVVQNQGQILTATNSTFNNGLTNGDGGVLTITSSTLRNTLINFNGSTLTADNITITGSQSYGFLNGAIGGTATIRNSVITNNNGTGISNDTADLTIIDSTITGNGSSSTFEGGGIDNFDGNLTVIGSTISGNNTAANGGGIRNFRGNVDLTDTMISSNTATLNGGGIYNQGSVAITGTMITNNTASSGGGLYIDGDATLTDSTITDNAANVSGGGVFFDSGNFSQTNTTIANNTPDDIFGLNGLPIATDDAYNLDEDTTLEIHPDDGVLINDSDPDSDALTATLLSDVSNGSLSFNADGSFTYNPDANYNGNDSFTYEVSDGNSGTAQATVTLIINPINDDPAAQDDVATTDANDALPLLAADLLSNDSDIDGDALSIASVGNAVNGDVTLDANGNVLFTPASGFSGNASFDYTVSDGNGGTDIATVDVTVNPIAIVDELLVTANGSTEFYTVDSYGGSQDVISQLTFAPDGSGVEITGNSWKKLALAYTITPYTVLEFDFRSTTSGEIHGIGFDTDNNISANRTFKLYGTQNWGIDAFNNYTTPGTWQSYEIPVGDFFTGQMNYLTLTNDHDVTNPTANSQFRNIELVEMIPPGTPTVAVTVNGTPNTYTLNAAYNQDRAPQVTSTPDGSQLQLQGNSWKRINLNYTVTADTILELEFRSTVQGEIHGIGFDNDNGLSSDRIFQFYGTQSWGISDYENYATQASEWKFYQIRVGDHFTGAMPYLILVNDHDVANPDALSQFRNIKVYEGVNNQFGGSGNSTLTGGSGNDTLIGVDPNGMTPGLGEVDTLTGQGGADTFVLGDVTQAYYDDNVAAIPGLQDYALITDFDVNEGDVVQLSGTAAAYELLASPLGSGTAIYQQVSNESELIGIVEGVSNLDLTSSTFSFV